MGKFKSIIFILGLGLFLFEIWNIYSSYFLINGESEKLFEMKMINNKKTINNICSFLEFKPRLLVSVLYAERRSNITFLDNFESMFAELGNNTSIGIGQIRVKTAQWILRTVNDTQANYRLSSKYYTRFPKANTRTKIVELLLNDSLNLVLAAYHIKQMLTFWNKNGVSLTSRPDIITTLYTYGLTNRGTGLWIQPSWNAKSNILGKLALSFYHSNILRKEFPV